MADRSRREVKKNQDLQRILHLEKERARMRMIKKILKKDALIRTVDEEKILEDVPELVLQIQNNLKKVQSLQDRSKEIIDEPEVLSEKCLQLAKALKESEYTVIYSGAGISTSAQIPDYRGPDGVWTLLQKGKDIKLNDLSLAEPTYTHMAIKQLHEGGLVPHIVSQNCDGLHLRSGLPTMALSELHGNMYIEVCPKCKPLKQYIRLFDVTERTGLHRHSTGRFCRKCNSELQDTIVHFGEKGKLPYPMNWKGASKAAEKAQLILCLGTSLKVLRRYPGLWNTDRPHKERPKLYIVNLQWTPKDTQATLKIHGKCDDVMRLVTKHLGITVPEYNKQTDPIFNLATALLPKELCTTTRLILTPSPKDDCDTKSNAQTKLDISTIDFQKLDCQPCVRLLDISMPGALLKLNAKKLDPWTYSVEEEQSDTKLTGWYGKGCAKWKKHRRRTNSVQKKIKLEEQDS